MLEQFATIVNKQENFLEIIINYNFNQLIYFLPDVRYHNDDSDQEPLELFQRFKQTSFPGRRYLIRIGGD